MARFFSLFESIGEGDDSVSNSMTKTRLRIWIILLIGIICVLLAIYVDGILVFDKELNSFILQLGKTFIAASVIALVLRVPTLLNDVNNSSIKLLKSNEFLKKLSITELKGLRASATESAYSQSADSVNESLKNLDLKIANLFLEPYFQFYHINVRCRILENGNVEKLISTHFTLKNPKREECDGLKHYKSRVVQEKIDNIEQENLRKLQSLQILKDGDSEFKDYTNDFQLEFKAYSEESSDYNTTSEIKPKNSSDFKFKDSLQIKIVEKRTVGVNDNVYLHRINSPAEDFSVNYSFDNCEVDLIGNGFGTFQSTKDGGINIFKDGNSIHISSKRWLITGNGIIIVHNFRK